MDGEREVGGIGDVRSYFNVGRNAAYDLCEKVSKSSHPWAKKLGGVWKVNLSGMRGHIPGGETCRVIEKIQGPASTSPTFATLGAGGHRSRPRMSESQPGVSVSSNWRAVNPAPTR
jgi:hypothetical protein